MIKSKRFKRDLKVKQRLIFVTQNTVDNRLLYYLKLYHLERVEQFEAELLILSCFSLADYHRRSNGGMLITIVAERIYRLLFLKTAPHILRLLLAYPQLSFGTEPFNNRRTGVFWTRGQSHLNRVEFPAQALSELSLDVRAYENSKSTDAHVKCVYSADFFKVNSGDLYLRRFQLLYAWIGLGFLIGSNTKYLNHAVLETKLLMTFDEERQYYKANPALHQTLNRIARLFL